MYRVKIFLGLFFLSVFANTAFSQSVGINYYSTGSGRNITSVYSFGNNKNEFGFGIGYNINSIKQPDDQSNIYYKRLYATRFYQHLNLNLTYQRYVLSSNDIFKPFVFYDLQLKYSTTRSSMYIPYAFDSTIIANTPDEKILYRKYIVNFGPFLWVENTIGIGFMLHLYKQLYLKQMAGMGIVFTIGHDNQLAGRMDNWMDWEFGGLLNLGIVFRFSH